MEPSVGVNPYELERIVNYFEGLGDTEVPEMSEAYSILYSIFEKICNSMTLTIFVPDENAGWFDAPA